ncbi:MAG: App1 family protein [Pseudonocardia sp.]
MVTPPRLVRTVLAAEAGLHAAIIAVRRLFGRHRRMILPFVAYGTPTRARVGARVVLGRPAAAAEGPRSRWAVLRSTLARFFTLELPRVPVTIVAPGGGTTVATDREGYVDAVVELPGLPPGRHEIRLCLPGDPAHVSAPLVVADPAATVGVVSDIDDTVVETGITRGLAFLRITLFTDVAERTPLPGAAALYRALDAPVFYVSTSPWNLHELLLRFLQLRGFPLGPLLLTDWGPSPAGLFRIGAAEHKTALVRRVLDDHPGLGLVLVGDSGQHDPEIYAALARAHGDRIRAVYIRRTPGADHRRRAALDALAAQVSAAGVPMVAVDDSVQIAVHAATLGLLDAAGVAAVRADTADQMR